MINWQLIPAFRYLISIVIGIIIYIVLDRPYTAEIHFVFCSILGLILLLTPRLSLSLRSFNLFMALILLSIARIGLLDDKFASSDTGQEMELRAYIITCPKRTKRGQNFVIRPTFRKYDNKWIPYEGPDVQSYFKSDHPHLSNGEAITIKAKLWPVSTSKNPKAFDYQRYLRLKNVHLQAYLEEADIVIQQNKHWNLMLMAQSIQNNLSKILEQHLVEASSLAVAKALLIGDKNDIDLELRNRFADTGAMHVLAVSGLHVGILASGLFFILGLLPILRKASLRNPIILLAVWIFAFMTGASPSVLRAASLISLVLLGKTLFRHLEIYNLLAAVAVILLLWNPFMLFDVGFQLSFVALLGIVYIQPKIDRLLYINTYLAKKIWQLISVSIAAQIATMPLSLYYFHQISTVFWMSGIIAIPLAFIILSLGFALFASSYFFPPLSFVFGKCLSYALEALNISISFLSEIPNHVVEEIWICPVGLFLILSALMLWPLYLYKKTIALYFLTSVWLAGTMHYASIEIQRRSTEQITIYHDTKNTIIDFNLSGKAYSVSKELPLSHNIQSNRLASKMLEPIEIRATHECADYRFNPPFLQVGPWNILWLDDSIQVLPECHADPDILLYDRRSDDLLETALNKYKSKNYVKTAKNRSKSGYENGFYGIKDKGAFIQNKKNYGLILEKLVQKIFPTQ